MGRAMDVGADGELRLAELLAALSVATDLGTGHEPEKAVRSCLLATDLARAADLPGPAVRDVYYTALLQHLGCTAPAPELAELVGDDLRFLSSVEGVDDASVRGAVELLGLVGRGTGLQRLRYVARVLLAGPGGTEGLLRSTCEAGSRLAERLHLGDGVTLALASITEVWDGSGGPDARRGEDIPLAARFALVASQATLFDRIGGPSAAIAVVRERAGHWFDPEVAATFLRIGRDSLRSLAEADVWADVLAAEPPPGRVVPSTQLDDVARVFADMVDLKSRFMLGHSSEVAALAGGAADRLGLDPDRVTTVRRAALLHDLGRIAVPTQVWEQARPLTTAQWEQVRLHPYHTERILDRATPLAPLARIAGMHHERQDGSGYHHRAAGATIPVESRLLAAADVFQAMTQERPHRRAHPPEQAAEAMQAAAAAGHLDVDCARAVVEAAGERASGGRHDWPAGLTDREVDVLRVLVKGATNRQIAIQLTISPRTAEHHVQHIYAKIGASTRASAALFAMEHGLVW